MKKLKTFVLLVLVAISVFCFSPTLPTLKGDHNPTWWDYDWNQRLEYTVNHSLVDEDLVNFPVLIYVDESVVDWGDVQNDLDDIRFTGDYLDELDFEIDSFTLNSEAWFWVRLPEVSSSLDTYFFMYYDNKFCVSGENAEAVWDEYTVMVLHMNDETTSTILDSTSNGNDGTKKAANEPIETDGKIGKSQLNDGINDYINFGDDVSISINLEDEFTVSAFVYPTLAKDEEILAYTGCSSDRNFEFKMLVGRELMLYITNGTANTAVTSVERLSLDSWNFVVGRYKKGELLSVTVNDVTKTVVPTIDFIPTQRILYSASLGELYLFFEGVIDENQVSSSSRSSAWVGASYYAATLELVYEGYHTGVSYARRGEILAAALVASLILIPLLTLIIFTARRKH